MKFRGKGKLNSDGIFFLCAVLGVALVLGYYSNNKSTMDSSEYMSNNHQNVSSSNHPEQQMETQHTNLVSNENNDGLPDIYFTSNQSKNLLYLNKGDFKFQNITDISGVGGNRAWSTGVTMVDINADGFLDIYVCNSGDVEGDNKQNELFINQGDMTFTEEATKYGLADPGYSTHASFFDYDKDGD